MLRKINNRLVWSLFISVPISCTIQGLSLFFNRSLYRLVSLCYPWLWYYYYFRTIFFFFRLHYYITLHSPSRSLCTIAYIVFYLFPITFSFHFSLSTQFNSFFIIIICYPSFFFWCLFVVNCLVKDHSDFFHNTLFFPSIHSRFVCSLLLLFFIITNHHALSQNENQYISLCCCLHLPHVFCSFVSIVLLWIFPFLLSFPCWSLNFFLSLFVYLLCGLRRMIAQHLSSLNYLLTAEYTWSMTVVCLFVPSSHFILFKKIIIVYFLPLSLSLWWQSLVV